MVYSVKEIFYTLQGEGIRSGRPAVFCRFSGCNLWSGREQDRMDAICKFCDTDFVGTDGLLGGKFESAEQLAKTIFDNWPIGKKNRYVVLTGGEPLLQVDEPLIDRLHYYEFEVAVETNGTISAPAGIDWICVSPKSGTNWVQRSGSELKLVFPQIGLSPEEISSVDFQHYLLQPMDGLQKQKNTTEAIRFCKDHPEWHLSVQTHKILQIP